MESRIKTVNNLNYNDVSANDFKSLGSITDEDEIKHKIVKESILNTTLMTNDVDYSSMSELSSKNQLTSYEYSVEDYDKLDVQKALSHMTVNDLNQFLNVYQVITSPDPNIDKTIIKASMKQLLSGELLDDEHLNNQYEESKSMNEEVINDSSDEHTFFDVYDHIESWRKRIQPTLDTINNVSQEYETIIQQTSTKNHMLNVKEETPNVSEKIFKNDNIPTSTSRFLSNIDKYIENSKIHGFLSEILHRSQDDNGIKNNTLSLDSNKYDSEIFNANGDKNKVTSFLINEENQQSLLTPSSAYSETEYKTNDDELDVKTYFIK